MNYLCKKLEEYGKTGGVIAMQNMWSAYTCDVITKYMFGFNYDQLASKDFSTTFHQVFIDSGVFGNITLHFPWVRAVCELLLLVLCSKATNIMQLMDSLPEKWVIAMNPAVEGLLNLLNVLLPTGIRVST
jgi:hypothetical protein